VEGIKNLRTRVAGLCDIKGEEESIPGNTGEAWAGGNVSSPLGVDAVKASGLREEEIASQACGVSYGSTEGALGVKWII